MSMRIAHFSDSHLGYEAYPALSAAGNNQRGEDVVRAFVGVAADIAAWDPDVVIHSGDVTERPKVDVRYMLVAQRQFAKLTTRADGRLRPVIVIAGNHDLPRSRKESCWLELLSTIPGVFVVCNAYEVLRFSEADGFDPALAELVVHALPHDALKEVDFDLVQPDPAAGTNVLVSHGVAAGSELFTRNLGREYAIEADVLARDWDYVALGHFHKRGPVAAGKRGGMDRAWYAGSSENISFRDLKENGTTRGYLRVALADGDISVEPIDLPIRRMERLAVVDATGLEAAEIEACLIQRLAGAEVAGVVVGQIVENVSRDMWSLVDVAAVRRGAEGALHYEISVRYSTSDTTEVGMRGLGDLAVLLEAEIAASVNENLREAVGEMARDLLGSALSRAVEEEADATVSGVDSNVSTAEAVVLAEVADGQAETSGRDEKIDVLAAASVADRSMGEDHE